MAPVGKSFCRSGAIRMEGMIRMRQIIAMGGGGFSAEPENPLLDRYILDQAGSDRPKVCLIPTARGDAEGYIDRFYTVFRQYDCEPSHLSLYRPPTSDLQSFILEKDIIYVGGGNTKNLLALWREWGLDRILKNAWESGIVLSGVSAGSICWFEEGVTDSFGVKLDRIPCLGLLPGSNCPHYDGETQRRPTFHRLLAENRIGAGLAADDGVALHFVGTVLMAVVSSRPAARAYRLGMGENGVVEEEIVPQYLGSELIGKRRERQDSETRLEPPAMRDRSATNQEPASAQVQIRPLREGERPPMELLLLADPSEQLVMSYIERGTCRVAELADEVVGVYVLLETRPETMELVNVAVRGDLQGEGIGKRLVLHAVAAAREAGARTIELGTGNSGVGQFLLYQKCGFRLVGVDVDFFVRHYDLPIYEHGVQCQDMIRMKREL